MVAKVQNPNYKPEDWDPMNYTCNEGQWVDWEDAAFLALAIEEAINRGSLSDLDEGDRRYLLDFVDFCRETGGFRIY